jgi:hypothetical protein
MPTEAIMPTRLGVQSAFRPVIARRRLRRRGNLPLRPARDSFFSAAHRVALISEACGNNVGPYGPLRRISGNHTGSVISSAPRS